jgi:hypothetical protein
MEGVTRYRLRRCNLWWVTTLAVVLGVAVFAGGCGDDDNPVPPAPTATVTPTATPESEASDPNFSTVSDILGGQRHLLRNDDLVVLQTFERPDTSEVLGSIVLQTTNSKVTKARRSDLATKYFQGGIALDVGRMFDLPNDVIAALFTPAGAQPPLTYHISDPVLGTVLEGPLPPDALEVDFAALADFTGDGYADLVIHNGVDSQRLRIATAKDVADMKAGLKLGDPAEAPSGCRIGVDITCPFAVGDFRGDGHREIAQVANDGRDLTLTMYTVDPMTLAITKGASVILAIPDKTGVSPVAIASGRFGTTQHDQLVLVYTLTPGGDDGPYRAVAIDIDAALRPTVKSTLDLGTLQGGGAFVVRSGRLNAFGPLDQAVVFAADVGPNVAVRILTFDENLTIANPARVDLADLLCGMDLAVGNFDHQQKNPQPPPDTQHDPNLQLAILSAPSCSETFAVTVFDVDPQHDFQPSRASTFTYQNAGETVSPYARLAAGDTQGRSLLLGAPQKVTITGHIQPDIVLGIPPMHIDYIRDIHNLGPDGHPDVLNISVVPSLPHPNVAFDTQYSFSESSSMSASWKNTTSYAFSTKETADAKISYGVPDVASLSVELKAAAKQAHDSTVAATYDTYRGVTDSLAATTGFADHLFFSQTRVNIFYYPVIRQTVCPAAKPNCADNEKRPLHVQFSGPDMVTQSDIDATTQEWYQPPWEPGNVFSYPWSLALLQQAYPRLTPLTTNPAPRRGTDTSEVVYATTWTQGSGTSQSSGSVSTNSTDVSISVAAKASIEGFGIDGSAGFDANSSQSVGTVNTSTQTVSSSTGVQVNKPDFGDVVAENYLYDFGGYVFGLTPPAGTVQSIPLTNAQHQPISIQSTGPLVVGFVADPRLLDGQPLPWWLQAYKLPDVALNHPERWDWSESTRTASFNLFDKDVPPLDQSFYHMKGLFITPADATGAGPQLETATAGDQLQLQARVYNFSLVDMPADAAVHVRFYGQVWDNAELQGDSFLIGEDVIAPIPGFPSTSTGNDTMPNWALARTTFDTTGRNNQYLVFWVLVWMEDPSGALTPELEGHGLTGNPRALSFAKITEVPTEAYSNNVGLYGYNTPFFIAAPTSPLGKVPSTGDLTIDRIDVPLSPILLDTKTKVSVVLRTGATPLGTLLVLFYDGDPREGGRPFDVQQIPAIPANSTYVSRVFFRPQTEGDHTVFVVAAPGTAGAVDDSVTLSVIAAP